MIRLQEGGGGVTGHGGAARAFWVFAAFKPQVVLSSKSHYFRREGGEVLRSEESGGWNGSNVTNLAACSRPRRLCGGVLAMRPMVAGIQPCDATMRCDRWSGMIASHSILDLVASTGNHR